MAQSFDFVVVGGGTAGCLLASRLASSKLGLTVALLEGGDDINKTENRISAERYSVVEKPGIDYGYVSTAQKYACLREVPQARGKGLGGSSAANFQVWSLGAADEFEAWADAAGDQVWGFDSVLQHVRQLETLHLDGIGHEWAGYIKPDPKNHGFSGPIDVSIGPVEKEVKSFFDAGVDLGHTRNLDPNGGRPIGFSMSPQTAANGLRTTSASAFLGEQVPANLSVFTKHRVVKILFEQDKAVAVQMKDGTRICARREVIVCAGALDSPRLLLLSGVGPREDLEALGVEVVRNLEGVGKSFTDHPMVCVCVQMKPGFTERMSLQDPEKYQQAMEMFLETGKGPLLGHYSSCPHAFLKNPRAYESTEFKDLSEDTRKFLLGENVPSYELILGPLMPPTHVFDEPGHGFFSMFVANMNSVSRGQVKLATADPKDAPLIDPNYLSNPFDLVNLREALREGLALVKAATMQDHYVRPLFGPKSESNEDLEEFIKQNIAGLWHPSCSVAMGRNETDGSCVNSDLKVHGLRGLRVADLSVTPLLPSGHPQIVAYVIGQIAADKIIQEHEQKAKV